MLRVRPYAWSTADSSVEVYGYTSEREAVYLRISTPGPTYIMTWPQPVTPKLVDAIEAQFEPLEIETSPNNPHALILLAPAIVPTESPADPLAAFWRRNHIRPYDWLQIEASIPTRGTTAMNIQAYEAHVKSVGYTPFAGKLAFWDIETFASRKGMFPDATHPEDAIFLISLILVDGTTQSSYVLLQSTVPKPILRAEWTCQFPEDTAHLVVVPTEAELLTRFFAILARFQPDRYVYYNGDMFDLPYVLKRVQLLHLEVPAGLSKKLGVSLVPVSRHITTPVGVMEVPTIPFPDIEIVDLLYVYRRLVLPHLPNHRLDTVATSILGVGKTDLPIEELMAAVRTQDPAALARGIHYSWIDSVRMVELWNASALNTRLETIANRLRVSISALLHSPALLHEVMFQLDPGMIPTSSSEPAHLESAAIGIHHVYSYDYSELYRLVLLRAREPAIRELAARLQDAPPELIFQAFYSGYVREQLSSPLRAEIERMRRAVGIVAIEPTVIRLRGPLVEPYLRLISVDTLASITAASYILVTPNGTKMVGTAKLCRPPFPLARTVIEDYLKGVDAIPRYEEHPLEDFVLHQRVDTIYMYEPGTVQYALSQQLDPASTGSRISYVMTTDGPVILSRVLATPDEFVLDIEYYHGIIQSNLGALRKLPVHPL